MVKVILFLVSISLYFTSFSYHTAFADSMQREAQEIGGKEGLNFMLDNFYPVFNKDYEDGVEWATFVQELAENNRFKQQLGRANLSLGVIHYLHGDYEKSIQHYQTALDIFEELNDLQYLGRTHNEMYVYSRKQGQFEESLKHVENALNYCSQCQDFPCLVTACSNQGIIYQMQGEYELANQAFRKALDIALKQKIEVSESYVYENIGETYRLMKQYDSTEFYLFKSLQIRVKLNDIQGEAMSRASLGDFYLNTGKYAPAKLQLLESLKLADAIQYPDLKQYVLNLLFEVSKIEGNLDEAITYIEQSNTLKDSVLNVEKLKSINELQVRYDTEKIRADYLEEQKARVQSELTVQSRNFWLFVIIGLTLVIVLLLLIVHQRKKKKLEQEKAATILHEKEKGLIAVFDATEKERQRIAKDLHDSVGQQLSGLKLAWANLTKTEGTINGDKDKIIQLTEVLNNTANEVREISHQMMPKVLSEFGLSPAIEDMLEKSLQFTPLKYEFEQFNLNDRLDQRIEVSLYRICQELINNVIKHSNATFVSVQLIGSPNAIVMIVEDNGLGLEETNVEGHGILNIKSRLNTINGEVNYQPGLQSGTTATVKISLL